MLIPALTGFTIGEGISRLLGNEHSPRIVQKITQPTYAMLQSQYCITLVAATFFTNALCKAIIPKAQPLLMNRKGFVATCAQTSLSIVGLCTFSTTFVLATVIYVARRRAVLTFLMGFQKLYLLLKELEIFVSKSLSDPSQFVEKFSAEITKELEEINEVAQAMMFDSEPEAIKEIDQEISSFEEHLKALEAKMPEFKLKLDGLLKRLQENQEKLANELSQIEAQAKKLENLLIQINKHPQGFCERVIKKYVDFESLKQRNDRFQNLFKEGIALSKQALIITHGLFLIEETNSLEDKAINVWFSIVKCTHLPMVQDMALTAVSVPILIRELGRACMHNQFRRDAFLNFKAKRIILSRKFPEDVAEFRDGLIHLSQARTSIFNHLSQMTALEPMFKEDWAEETEHITKGGSLLKKSSCSLQAKLSEDRNKRGLIKTFII